MACAAVWLVLRCGLCAASANLFHLDTEADREVRVGETRVECVVPVWREWEGRGGEGVVSVGCGVAVAAAVLLLCCAATYEEVEAARSCAAVF